jgi:hypothetical protein
VIHDTAVWLEPVTVDARQSDLGLAAE